MVSPTPNQPMPSGPAMAVISLGLLGLEEIRRRWAWFLVLGLVMVALGLVAIGWSSLATLASVLFVGWLLIVAGVTETVFAFQERCWSGFFLDLLAGLLYLATGVLIVVNPGAAAVTLTLLIAFFLVLGGLFRILFAISTRVPNWGWLTLHGAINVALGVLIWNQWPLSGLWVIGLFLGIDLTLNGWTLVMLSLVLKNGRDRAIGSVQNTATA